MEGLASSLVQPQQSQQMSQMPTVEEVVALLMQGVAPEELEQMGIPQELIMEAITILEQEIAAQQQQSQAAPAQMGGGLAAKSVSGM